MRFGGGGTRGAFPWPSTMPLVSGADRVCGSGRGVLVDFVVMRVSLRLLLEVWPPVQDTHPSHLVQVVEQEPGRPRYGRLTVTDVTEQPLFAP